MSFRIVTWNVNSVGARLPLLLKWLESSQAEIVCLQEIKCMESKFPATVLETAGYQSVAFGQPAYNGVAILVRQDFLTQTGATISDVQKGFPDDAEDAQKRLIAATIGGVRVVNVYVPNGQAVGSDKYQYKLEWYAKLRQFLEQTGDASQPLALCGDFNVAPENIDVYDPKVWEGQVLFSVPERQALQKVVDWGLHDSFRELHPEEQVFSWWDYRVNAFKRNLGLRIDHMLVTQSLMARCESVEIDKEPRTWERPSDHTPVVATFSAFSA